MLPMQEARAPSAGVLHLPSHAQPTATGIPDRPGFSRIPPFPRIACTSLKSGWCVPSWHFGWVPVALHPLSQQGRHRTCQYLWFLCSFCFLLFLLVSVKVGGPDTSSPSSFQPTPFLLLLFTFSLPLRSLVNPQICHQILSPVYFILSVSW